MCLYIRHIHGLDAKIQKGTIHYYTMTTLNVCRATVPHLGCMTEGPLKERHLQVHDGDMAKYICEDIRIS